MPTVEWPDRFAHKARVRPGREQMRGMRVPQIMEPDTPEVGPRNGTVERGSNGVGIPWRDAAPEGSRRESIGIGRGMRRTTSNARRRRSLLVSSNWRRGSRVSSDEPHNAGEAALVARVTRRYAAILELGPVA